MHFLIVALGLILWYIAYEAKPNINEEVSKKYNERDVLKRIKLLSILNEVF